jgi:hypothetical protein
MGPDERSAAEGIGDADGAGFDHVPGGLIDGQPGHLAGFSGRVGVAAKAVQATN